MTTALGEVKGLKAVLEEHGFDIKGLKAKCSLVCPFESQKCCLARLLSQQDDFVNQESMLKTLIKEAGHKCLFLPKFHCELNPIEMVSLHNLFSYHFSCIMAVLGLVQILIPRTHKRKLQSSKRESNPSSGCLPD